MQVQESGNYLLLVLLNSLPSDSRQFFLQRWRN